MNNSSNKPSNLTLIAEDYIKLMIDQVSGMKSIVFDADTKVMFSLITSKSNAIKEEIFMFEEIKNLKPEEKYLNIKGLFFLRPTNKNIEMLCKILKNPNFVDIYLFFSNSVTEDNLRKLAHTDEYSSVKAVQEVYLDYFVINSKLFHLDIDSTPLIKNANLWKSNEYFILDRIVDGILSTCLSMRLNPVIKYVKNNEMLKLIADKVNEHTKNNYDGILSKSNKETNGTLLLYDRKEDPITPLISQWTYQAMIHDIFGIYQNICTVKNERLVLSDSDDMFFKENLDKTFGEVAAKIKEKIDTMTKSNDVSSNELESFEEIKNYIENLPQKKKESMEITKHTGIIYELTHNVETRNLLNLSLLEQDIACKDDKKDQLNRLIQVLKDTKNLNNKEKIEQIKLFLLFVLRYENDVNSINVLKDLLKENSLGDYTEYAEVILYYAGQAKRTCDLLNNKDFLSNTFFKITQALKDVPNVFTQHTSLLSSILKKLFNKGKLNEIETLNNNNNKTEKLNKVLVFCVGGVTYEEARDVNSMIDISKSDIVLGGTSIINSKIFLNSLTDIALELKKKEFK